MRITMVMAILLTSVSANAAELTESEITAQRLLSALDTVNTILRKTPPSDLSAEQKRDCYVAQAIFEQPFVFYRLPEVGPGNENALAALSENLEAICSRGPYTKLELFGLQFLSETVLQSRTTSGDNFENYIRSLVSDTWEEALHAQSSKPGDLSLSETQVDSLRIAISSCWNVGSLSTDALGTTVVVEMSITESGVLESGSIRLVSYSSGTEASAGQAFDAARRAIIRCGSSRGLNIREGDYELTFAPEGIHLTGAVPRRAARERP